MVIEIGVNYDCSNPCLKEVTQCPHEAASQAEAPQNGDTRTSKSEAMDATVQSTVNLTHDFFLAASQKRKVQKAKAETLKLQYEKRKRAELEKSGKGKADGCQPKSKDEDLDEYVPPSGRTKRRRDRSKEKPALSDKVIDLSLDVEVKQRTFAELPAPTVQRDPAKQHLESRMAAEEMARLSAWKIPHPFFNRVLPHSSKKPTLESASAGGPVHLPLIPLNRLLRPSAPSHITQSEQKQLPAPVWIKWTLGESGPPSAAGGAAAYAAIDGQPLRLVEVLKQRRPVTVSPKVNNQAILRACGAGVSSQTTNECNRGSKRHWLQTVHSYMQGKGWIDKYLANAAPEHFADSQELKEGPQSWRSFDVEGLQQYSVSSNRPQEQPFPLSSRNVPTELAAAGVDVNAPLESDKFMWTDKYQPASSQEICGNKAAVQAICDWLNKWRVKILTQRREPPAFDAPTRRSTSSEIDKGVDNDDEWLRGFGDVDSDKEDDGLPNTLLLSGPVGCGKTATTYACARELGFNVIEINASDCRSGNLVRHRFGEATESHGLKRRYNAGAMSTSEKWSSVMGSSKRGKTKITTTNENESEVTTSVSITGTTPTPGDDLGPMMSMMLFEEADVLLEEDKGFTAALIHLAASKKRPIILMSNVSNPSLPAALLRHHVEFQTPRTRELFLQTAMVAAAEALQPPPSLMEHMIYSCSHDLRRLLLVFQFWGQMAQGPLQLRDTCGAGAEEALIQDVGPLVEEKQEKTCDSKPFAASEEANITQFNNELLAAAFESAEPMSTNEDGCQIKDWPLSRSRQGGGYSKARGLGTTTSIDGWPVDVGEVPYHEIQHRALSHFFDVACSCPLPVIVNEKITKTVQEEQQAAEMASAQLAMQTMLAERKRLEAAALLRKQERKAKAAARRAQLEGQTKTTAKLTNEQEGQKEGGRPAVPRENQLMEKSGTGLNCGSKDESLSRPEHEQRQGKRETRMLCALTESENLEKVGDGKPPSNLEGYVKERTKQKLLSGYLVGWICNSAMENETSTGTCPGLGAPMLPLFEVNRDDAVQAGPGSGRSIGSSTATEISGDEKLGISKRIARIGNMKRRRSKLKRQKKGVQMSPKAVDDDKACEICKKPEPEETMLLCDSCNAGWHMECLDPKILELPSGKWFCPLCMLHNAQHQGPEPVHMSKQTGRVDGIDRQASDGHLVNTRLPAPSEVKEQRLRNLVDTGLYRGSSVDEGVGMVKSEPDVGLCEISHQTAGVTVEDTRSDNGAICLQINDVSKRDGEKERFDRDTEDDDFERRNGIVLLESKVGEIAAGKAVGKLPSMRLRCLNEEAGCRAEDTARGRAEGVEGISSFLLNDSKDLGMSDVEKWCRAETSDVRGEQLESVINGMSKAECPVKGTGEVILCAAKCLQDGERPGEESNEGRKAMTDDFVQHLLKKAEYQLSSFNSLSQQIPAARDELYSSFVLTSKPMVDVENDKALSSCDLEEEPMQREDKGELAHDKGWIDGSGSFQQIGLPCILGEQQTVVASTEYGITTEHGVGNKVQQQRAETLNDSFHAGDVAPCCHQARPTEEVESVVNLSPKPDSLSVDAQLTNGNEQPREMSTEGAVLADATEDIREANPVTVERVWKSMLGERDAWQHLIEATFRQNEGILETVAGIVQSISDADVLSSLECFATMADLPFQQPCSTWSGRSLPDSWNRRASAEAAEAAVLLVEAASACCRPTPLPNKKLRKGPESPCGREIPQQAADGREPSPLLEDDAEGALPEAELAVTGAALFDMEKTWGKRCRLLERSVGEIVPPARRLCAARGACHEYAAYVGCMLQGAQEGTCDAGSRRGSSHAVVARSLRVNNDTVRCIQKCSTFGR